MFETLSSYKCRIGDFNLYGLDDNGCEWFIPFNGVDGVFNGATSTLSTSTKLWTDGYFTNRAVHAGRTVKLTGYIHGDCFDDILSSWDRFKAHLPFRETAEFTTTLRGISRLMYVEYQGEPLIKSEGNSLGKFSLTLVSRDALTYTPGDPLTGTTKLPSSEGGMTFPYVFNTFNTSLSSRWTGTPNASTSTLSQDGQVVATNLAEDPAITQTLQAYAGGGTWVRSPDATSPTGFSWTFTAQKNDWQWLGQLKLMGVNGLVSNPHPGEKMHVLLYAGTTLTNECSIKVNIYNGTSWAGQPNNVHIAPGPMSWSDTTFTMPADPSIQALLKSGYGIGTTGTVTIGAVMLLTDTDWKTLQSLGIDWFDGDSYPGRWVFDEHVVSGSVNLLTSGSGNPPVTIQFNGDVTNPQVLHVQSGKILAYSGRIAAGHYVLFDGQSRQVLIDGATPARGAATRLEWFTAQQGANTFQYSAERGEDTSTMTVSFREGWL